MGAGFSCGNVDNREKNNEIQLNSQKQINPN